MNLEFQTGTTLDPVHSTGTVRINVRTTVTSEQKMAVLNFTPRVKTPRLNRTRWHGLVHMKLEFGKT